MARYSYLNVRTLPSLHKVYDVAMMMFICSASKSLNIAGGACDQYAIRFVYTSVWPSSEYNWIHTQKKKEKKTIISL